MMKLSEAGPSSRRKNVDVRRHSSKGAVGVNESAHDNPPRSSRGRWVVGALALLAVVLIVTITVGLPGSGPAKIESPAIGAIPAAYDPDRAFDYLKRLCDIGPRPSGSSGMQRQQDWLTRFFTEQGASVSLQTFEIRHPENGSPVPMANLIASWHPGRAKRFLLCAHYDTRPYPDSDRKNKRGIFVGANDGASGTAALMELAHQLKGLPEDVGVDIVLFDGEEFIWQQGRDDYFLGSTFFAEKYKSDPPPVRYQAGVLLDMIGDRELKIYYEKNSMRYASGVARSIWRTASELGVRAFVSRSRHDISDDHIPLNQIAAIPTVDLIDFDYPRPGIGAPRYWHTELDVPEMCSGESLAAVVWVLDQWLKKQ